MYVCVVFDDALFCTRVMRRHRPHVGPIGSAQIEKLAKWIGVRRMRVGEMSFSRKKNSSLTDDIDRCRCSGIRRRPEELLRKPPKPIQTNRPIGRNAREMNGGTRPREVQGFCGERNNLERRADECGEYEGKNATRRSENSPFQITPDVLSIIPGISSKDPFDDRLKGKDNDVKWRVNA